MIYVLDEDKRKEKKKDRARNLWYDRIYSEQLPDGLAIQSVGGYDFIVTSDDGGKQVCELLIFHEWEMDYRYVLFIELEDYKEVYPEYSFYLDRLEFNLESLVSGYKSQNNPFYKYTFYYTNYKDFAKPSKWEAVAGYYAA